MKRVVFCIGSWSRHADVDTETLQALVDVLFRINLAAMRRLPVPALYGSNPSLVYRREKRDKDGNRLEDWRDCIDVLVNRCGDCEDLAAYRAAELVVQAGIEARPLVTYHPSRDVPGSTTYHVVVRHPNGSIEDPSRVLINREKKERLS